MNRLSSDGDAPERVVLAETDTIALGAATLAPSTRELIWPGGRVMLEPRVTQTLVALAQAEGRVVSRDVLVERCWGGLSVSEDAINRALSHARKAGREAGGAFEVETIARVGYRLVIHEGAGAQASDAAAAGKAEAPSTATAVVSRKQLFVAAGATLAVASGAGGWMIWRSQGARRPAPPQEAVDLLARAQEANAIATPGEYAQAAAFLERAVDIAPDYADAWGALSIAYNGMRTGAPSDQHEVLLGRQRAAAERALALDPKNVDGAVGMGLWLYRLGSWVAPERYFLRVLEANPANAAARMQLARVVADVGRSREALALAREAFDGGFATPRTAALIGELLWTIREQARALVWLEDQDKRWPRHTGLWFPRLFIHAYAGRVRQVQAMIDDKARRPLGVEAANFNAWILVAQAIAGKDSADLERALEAHRALARQGVGHAQNAIGVLAFFGEIDEAFQQLRAVYLGEGRCRTSPIRRLKASISRARCGSPAISSGRSSPRSGPIRASPVSASMSAWRPIGVKPARPRTFG
jgi:DNA-binding winged helix-turn-helix (wHTH) protein